MNICVAGWYYYEPFQASIRASRYPSFIVCHKEPVKLLALAHSPNPCRFASIPNIGLEFGCYDWYLKNEWQGGPVLFMHDDNEITEEALDLISQMTMDQAFLFSSEADALANGKAHGRAIFCSEKFLNRLKADGGFWYDERPCDGEEIPPTTADMPDYHNSAIRVFRAYLESLPKDEFSVSHVAVVPGLRTGYRGRI